MAVTAVFCLISAWNEFGFAMTLNNAQAVTVPVYFAGLQGNTNGVPLAADRRRRLAVRDAHRHFSPFSYETTYFVE